MTKRPDPNLSDSACQRRAEAAGERATELELPRSDHLTKCELAVRDALWAYWQCLESPYEHEWGEDMGVIAEMDHAGWRISILKHDGTKVPLIEIWNC
jgi:hypothetical protein